MFFKLFKYEIKSECRAFISIYAIIFLATVTAVLGNMLNIDIIRILGSSVFFIAFLPIIVSFIFIINRRYINNLYKTEGYLMLTLPVKPHMLLTSKIASAIFWVIATILVSGLCLFILGLSFINFEELREVMQEINLNIVMDYIFSKPVIVLLIMIILSSINILIKMYFSISLSYTVWKKNGNGFVAVIIFFVISFIEEKILSLPIFFHEMDINSYEDFGNFISLNATPSIIFDIILFIVYFFLIVYMLDKKYSIR